MTSDIEGTGLGLIDMVTQPKGAVISQPTTSDIEGAGLRLVDMVANPK